MATVDIKLFGLEVEVEVTSAAGPWGDPGVLCVTPVHAELIDAERFRAESEGVRPDYHSIMAWLAEEEQTERLMEKLEEQE